MHASVMEFALRQLQPDHVRGQRVLEVGSVDVNGSVRPIVCALGASEYMGVDAMPGNGVDRVVDGGLVDLHFGLDSFDLVISTEMLEHARDWHACVNAMKRVVRPGGYVLLTTRSPGYWRHEYPSDYWRFTQGDMRSAFADFDLIALEDDPQAPGVFVYAQKPRVWWPADISSLKVTAAP